MEQMVLCPLVFCFCRFLLLDVGWFCLVFFFLFLREVLFAFNIRKDRIVIGYDYCD